MLMGVISPTWSNIKEADFMEALDAWEFLAKKI